MVSKNFMETLEYMAIAIGYDNAMIICNKYQGEQVFIPLITNETPDEELPLQCLSFAELIGFPLAKKLCKMFTGEIITFPKGLQKLSRDEQIHIEFERGKTYRDLSLKYGLTTRHIRHILASKIKKVPKEFKDTQLALF